MKSAAKQRAIRVVRERRAEQVSAKPPRMTCCGCVWACCGMSLSLCKFLCVVSSVFVAAVLLIVLAFSKPIDTLSQTKI